jgi:hypothetical protein
MQDFQPASRETIVPAIHDARGYPNKGGLGAKPYWTGKGADGGRDLVCMEMAGGQIAEFERKWVVSCKHKKSSSVSVGVQDVDGVVDLCRANDASGYLLVCSTHVSSAAAERLKALSSSSGESRIVAKYWDAVQLETLLRTPRTWPIAQQFFPVSSARSDMTIFATESPNFWIGNPSAAGGRNQRCADDQHRVGNKVGVEC